MAEWSLQETVIFEISPDTPVSMETGQEPSNVFVTEATWNSAGDHFCVGGSNGDVKLYNWASERGASLSLRIHHGHVASPRVKFDHVDPNFLWTCADDGEVRMWDLRTSSVAMAYRVGEKKKQRNLLSCDVSRDRNLVAAGSAIASDDAIIYFWDVRNTNTLAEFAECHNDDITQLHFHPTEPRQLMTSSEDGLISTFILKPDMDEDESLESVMNTLNTPAKIGYCGPTNELVYCTTNVQTLSIWNHVQALKVHDFGDIRSAADPRPVDYIVDCQYDPKSQRLALVTGTYEGQGEVFTINGPKLEHNFSLKKGHVETIRSSHFHFEKEELLTVGEDSRLCVWGSRPVQLAEPRKPKVEHVTKRGGYSPYKKN